MSTTDNLNEAFAGESQANRKYLAFAKKAELDGYPQVARLFRAAAEAEKEGNKGALMSFKYAMAVEEVHHGLYSKALEAVKSGKDLAPAKIWICPTCGNTFSGEAPDKCPVCSVDRKKFVEIA
jgi:rubrerythrin